MMDDVQVADLREEATHGLVVLLPVFDGPRPGQGTDEGQMVIMEQEVCVLLTSGKNEEGWGQGGGALTNGCPTRSWSLA